jgi:hypothetical protein
MIGATDLLRVTWSPRAVPLSPVAVAGEGAVARSLGRRLLRDDESTLSRLTALAAADLLLVAGASEDLPWVDGVTYLGRDPLAPLLLLPTQHAPAVPVPWLERALIRQSGGDAGSLAVLPLSGRLIRLSQTRALARTALEAWYRHPAVTS